MAAAAAASPPRPLPLPRCLTSGPLRRPPRQASLPAAADAPRGAAAPPPAHPQTALTCYSKTARRAPPPPPQPRPQPPQRLLPPVVKGQGQAKHVCQATLA